MVIIKVHDGVKFRTLKPSLVILESINKQLSFAETATFQYPVTDPKCELLTNAREVRFYEEEDGVQTFLTGGYIESEPNTILAGDDRFKSVVVREYTIEFGREYGVPNVSYINVPYTDVLDPSYPKTFIRPTTWTSVVEPTTAQITFLSSLQTSGERFSIAERQIGYKWRYIGDDSTPRKIEFGIFGNPSGVKIRQAPKSHHELGDDVLVIQDTLTKSTDYEAITNYLYVLGGGDRGMNQVTLRDVDPALVTALGYPIFVDPEISNDDTVYDVTVYGNEKTASNTNKTYYIKDDTSIATYGSRKGATTFNDIAPIQEDGIEFTAADRENAANELYRAAVQALVKAKDPIVVYTATCIGKTLNLKIGDTVNLKYNGEVKLANKDKTGTDPYVYSDINEDLIVTSMSISYVDMNSNLKSFTLELSPNGERLETDQDIVLDIAKQVKDFSSLRGANSTTDSQHFKDSLDSISPATFLFTIPGEMVRAARMELEINIKKFRAYSKAVAGGGSIATSSGAGGGTVTTTDSEGTGQTAHQHSLFTSPTSSDRETLEGAGYYYMMVLPDPGNPLAPCPGYGGLHVASKFDGGYTGSQAMWKTNCTINGHFHSLTLPNHVHTVTLPNHTHPLQFGIFENPDPFTGVKIYIDGIDYSGQFGVWNTTGFKPTTGRFDILKAASNLGQLDNLLTPGKHIFEARCASGLVFVEMSIFYQFHLSSR